MTVSKPRISTTSDGWEHTERILGADFKRRRGKLIQLLSKIMDDQAASDGKWILADDQPYLLDGVDRKPYRIDARDTRFKTLMAYRYGIEPGEPTMRALTSLMEASTRVRGQDVEVHRFSWFDRERYVLYLSRYDGTAWKLDGERCTIVQNGAEVLFLDDDDAEPVRGDVDPTPTIQGTPPDGNLFKLLVEDLSWRDDVGSGLTPDVQRALLSVWIHAVAFQSMLATRPILLLEGSKGSGKTVAVQRIQLALTGQTFPLIIGENEEDFGVQLLRSPIACLDNVDSNKPWLRDAMCTFTSSGGTKRRKRYSDTDQVRVKPETLIAVTSRNPTTFRRDDVADRCLVLRLERRSAFSGSWIFDNVRAARPKMYAEWLWRLNATLRALREMDTTSYANNRLADYAHLTHAVGQGSLGASAEEVGKWLAAAEAEREMLTLETDPLIVALDAWLPSNYDVSFTAIELHQALSKAFSSKGTGQSFYQNPRALASRIANVTPALEHRYGCSVQRSPAHSGVFRYTFVQS